MTRNLLEAPIAAANQMQGFRMSRAAEQQGIKDRAALDMANQAQTQATEQLNALKQRYAEEGDPAIMRQIIVADPQFASQMQKQFGVIDDNTRTEAMNQAGALKQMLEQDPQQAMQYWQQNLAQNPAFAELADNFQTGDYEGALNEIGWGVTALGGQEAYDSLFGAADQTAFIQELTAAGIKPGTEEFKGAVLERYGKGDTIGYDVIEGVNPETGRNEYYQVSRVNPDEKIPLGIEVPMSAAELKTEAANNAKIDDQRSSMTATLQTVGKILSSPGLSGFSGLDSFRRFIPGSEAANVAAWIEQLQSQNFLTAVDQMKGMGALSENEGKKIAGAVAAISPSMSDKAIISELQKIEQDLLVGLERMETGNLLTDSSDSQPAPASGTVNWSDL